MAGELLVRADGRVTCPAEGVVLLAADDVPAGIEDEAGGAEVVGQEVGERPCLAHRHAPAVEPVVLGHHTRGQIVLVQVVHVNGGDAVLGLLDPGCLARRRRSR